MGGMHPTRKNGGTSSPHIEAVPGVTIATSTFFLPFVCAIHERGSEGRGCACKQLEAFICVAAIIIGYRGLSCVKTFHMHKTTAENWQLQ